MTERTEQEGAIKRVFIAGVGVLVVFMMFLVGRQAFRDSDSLNVALDQLKQGAAARTTLLNEVKQLLHTTKRDEVFVLLVAQQNKGLRHVIAQQNKELISLGLKPVKLPKAPSLPDRDGAPPPSSQSSQSSPSPRVTPKPSPSPRPSPSHTSKPPPRHTPKPSPKPTTLEICVTVVHKKVCTPQV